MKNWRYGQSNAFAKHTRTQSPQRVVRQTKLLPLSNSESCYCLVAPGRLPKVRDSRGRVLWCITRQDLFANSGGGFLPGVPLGCLGMRRTGSDMRPRPLRHLLWSTGRGRVRPVWAASTQKVNARRSGGVPVDRTPKTPVPSHQTTEYAK